MSVQVGEVIAVNGVRITLRVFDESSKETLYFGGEKFKGVSIREYLAIERGFISIVCMVEGEYLDESRLESQDGKVGYIRKVDVRPIGYFLDGNFQDGIKYMPMIKDPAFLLQEQKIASIYSKNRDEGFVVGKLLKEEIPISLPWHRLFNSHIGIFGNTGSGKSNTLAKLFTTLFDKKAAAMEGKSRFVVLDFNGEYTASQLTTAASKAVLRLNTAADNGDRFELDTNEFWNTETLSILFQATQNTQRPFLTRVIDGRKRFLAHANALSNYVRKIYAAVFSAAAPKPELLDLLRRIAAVIGDEPLINAMDQITWIRTAGAFRTTNGAWFNPDGVGYTNELAPIVDAVNADGLDAYKQLVVRANLQLCRDMILGYVQFEHIQPLLKRIEASLNSLRKVIAVGGGVPPRRLLTVISLRRCNNEMKKVLPLLIAKHFYNEHKVEVGNPPEKTFHLIIDEAHNILSAQSTREHESWKDYRLELFEEIIKEGRKFGMYVTVSSQRPADISPTIISQLHNFFIHRLVNDRDLFLLENTITTLDGLSKGLIPNLAKGCCVVTGTSFELPMVLQIDALKKDRQPDSEDVNLAELWR